MIPGQIQISVRKSVINQSVGKGGFKLIMTMNSEAEWFFKLNIARTLRLSHTFPKPHSFTCGPSSIQLKWGIVCLPSLGRYMSIWKIIIKYQNKLLIKKISTVYAQRMFLVSVFSQSLGEAVQFYHCSRNFWNSLIIPFSDYSIFSLIEDAFYVWNLSQVI